MKKLLLIIALLIPMGQLSAQKTLFDSENLELGGFGGVVLKTSIFNDEPALMIGGRGALSINKSFFIGGGGYGLVTNNMFNRELGPDTTLHLELGYGGVEFGYVINSDELLHLTTMVHIGGGGMSYTDRDWDEWDNGWDDEWDRHHYNGHNYGHDYFFVIEPHVNAELNVFRWMKVAAGVSYRFTTGADYYDISDSDLSGLSGNLTFKFGGNF